MARRKTIVKRLNAIQNFGAMDVLCTDKTGTLTQDKVVLDPASRHSRQAKTARCWSTPSSTASPDRPQEPARRRGDRHAQELGIASASSNTGGRSMKSRSTSCAAACPSLSATAKQEPAGLQRRDRGDPRPLHVGRRQRRAPGGVGALHGRDATRRCVKSRAI